MKQLYKNEISQYGKGATKCKNLSHSSSEPICIGANYC